MAAPFDKHHPLQAFSTRGHAGASIANDDEIVVIGSQSILGQFPDAPAELCVSNEADLYPLNHPTRADLIDDRLIPIRTPDTRGATGLCPEVHDLAISKYVASRDQDRRFLRDAIRFGLLSIS